MKHISLGGLDVSRIGLGTMAMSGYYLDPQQQRRRVDPHHPASTRVGRHPHRHRRDLRPVRQRGARRPRPQGASRPRGRGDEVRLGLPRRRWPRSARQQSGEHPDRGRGLPEAAGDRPHRPLLPAPGRPEHAHRGHRRRPGRAGGRGQGPAHRPVRGRARDDPPRPRRAPDRRAADRVLPVDPRPRRPSCCRCCASSASASCPTHRSGTASSPGRSAPPKSSSDDDWRKTNPRFTEGNFEKNLRIVDEVQAVASEVGATPAQIALAWLLAQGDDIAPIPGTKRVVARRGEHRGRRDRAERGADPTAERSHPATGERHDEANMAAVER